MINVLCNGFSKRSANGIKTILAIHKTFLIWTTGEPSSNFPIRSKDNAKLIAARMSNTLPNILPETFIIPCVGQDKITIPKNPNNMLTISNLLAFFLKSNTKNTNVKTGTIAISIDAILLDTYFWPCAIRINGKTTSKSAIQKYFLVLVV